jgi:alkylation response protein AidB-like acyl-CoA dehydrogenase
MSQPDLHHNESLQRGPIYRALWEDHEAISKSFAATDQVPEHVQSVMDASLAVLRQHRTAKTLRGPDGKHSEQVLGDLGRAGYWGLLVRRDFGGSGCALRHFLPFITRAAVIDAPLAGLAAVHGCIGAVDPLQTFGTPEQQARWLPKLASGERLSAFASTEPGAGSDLTGVQMTAIRDGDVLKLTGQKAFITNLAPGRTIGMLCKHDGQLAVVIVELPERENEQFRLVPNPLHPLKHTINQGMQLTGFGIPASNLLTPPAGKDGRAIVFHGLNRGRAALCALAAGHLRVILAGMIAWAKERIIRQQQLGSLELIQARIGRVAALIAGCDLLAQWCGTLLDAGYRAECECITAKVFASEAVKHAAVDLALPTHGGRFFLQGHPTGDMVYDYLAPCIYEGENDLLCLAMFHTLTKGLREVRPPSAAPSDPLDTHWLSLRARFERLNVSHHPPLQMEMVAIAREAQKLSVLSLVKASQSPDSQRNATELLCLRLERQFDLECRSSSVEFEQEVTLGKALVANPPQDLADAPLFVNPLPAT